MKDALTRLLNHPDPSVQRDAALVKTALDHRSRIISMIQTCLQELRLEVKYLVFDLECTRRERNELKG